MLEYKYENKFQCRCDQCGVSVAPACGYYTGIGVSRKYWCVIHVPDVPLRTLRTDSPEPMAVNRPRTQEPRTQEPLVPQAQLDAAVAKIAELTAQFAMTALPGLVKAQLEQLAPRKLEVTIGKAAKVTVSHSHVMLPTVLQAMISGAAPLLIGPAGSGKTTLAQQVATVMKLKFYMSARVTSEFKLLGFMDATGKYVRTQFRDAYEHGGIFLFDEIDASDADAMTTFNAGLAGDYCDFPDGMVKRHKDFYAIAAGNTYGRGADRMYVGRNQLDAATLDRFEPFEVDYDEVLELALAGDADWVGYVQRVRKAVTQEKVRHIVSPRASIKGAKFLAGGMERRVVEEACIWKGLPADVRQRVETRMVSI